MREILIACSLACLLACSDDESAQVDAGACPCSAVAASDVAYSPSAAGLSATDVQGAVDELALRPVFITDIHGLVTLTSRSMPSPAEGTDYSVTVACSGASDIALGGACESQAPGTSIASSRLLPRGYECVWNKPDGQAIQFVAHATCVRPAGG